jgi:hypothetical protein
MNPCSCVLSLNEPAVTHAEKRLKVGSCEAEVCTGAQEGFAVSQEVSSVVSVPQQKRKTKQQCVDEVVRSFVPVWKKQVFQKFITADSWALPGTASGTSLEKLRSETNKSDD